jgi:ATP-dependent protease ClpP protease subunit
MIQLQDQYLGYLVRNSKLSLEQWVEKEQATTWFNAKKAQEWGLVDKIE